MKFNTSKDGAMRATIRVEFRVERGTLVYALALAVFGHPTSHPTLLAANYSRSDVEQAVRQQYAVHGPPEQWVENAGLDWNVAMNAAEERVSDLFPEVPA